MVFVQGHYQLRVTVPYKLVIEMPVKAVTDMVVVIELPVDDHMDPVFRIVHWLVPILCQVIDGQTTVAQSYQSYTKSANRIPIMIE